MVWYGGADVKQEKNKVKLSQNVMGIVKIQALLFKIEPKLNLLLVPVALCSGLIVPANTLLIAKTADIFADGISTALVVCVVALTLLAAFGGIVRQLQNFVSNYVSYRCELPLKKYLLDRVKKIDIRMREQESFATKFMLANFTIGHTQRMIPITVITGVSALISTVSSLAIMMRVNVPLALAMIALSAVDMVIQYRAGNRMIGMGEKYGALQTKEDLLLGKITDRYAFAELKTSKRMAWFLGKWSDAYDAYGKENVKFQTACAFSNAFAPLLLSIGVYALMGIYGVTAAKTVADVMLVINSLLALKSGLDYLVHSLTLCNVYGGESNFVFDLFKDEWGSVREEGANDTPVDITLENVGFSYDGEHNAVDGINLTIKKGERLAIVGENGSGKTTLAKLILQLYRPTSGKIGFDGLAECRASALLQDFARYEMSARKNIAMGNASSLDDDAALTEAYRSVCGSELFLGLDEMLGVRFGGRDLSGGEWQRVALARAFIRDAPLIVLDEPNAAIDAFAETAMIRNMFALSKGRSCVFITHRLTTTALADRIIVMKDGKICEQGTHEELMFLNGEYARMYRTQSEMYVN